MTAVRQPPGAASRCPRCDGVGAIEDENQLLTICTGCGGTGWTAARQPPGPARQEPSAEAMIAAGRWIGDGALKKRLAAMFDAFAACKVEEGYDAAVKALRAAKPEQIPKPTIAELEAILNSPAPAVHINPDGSISAGQGQFEKAADWLAANRPSSTGRGFPA